MPIDMRFVKIVCGANQAVPYCKYTIVNIGYKNHPTGFARVKTNIKAMVFLKKGFQANKEGILSSMLTWWAQIFHYQSAYEICGKKVCSLIILNNQLKHCSYGYSMPETTNYDRISLTWDSHEICFTCEELRRLCLPFLHLNVDSYSIHYDEHF